MAGRYFTDEQALEKEIKELFATASFNGTVFSLTNAKGVYSLAKTATGTYKLELEDKYVALRSFKAVIFDSTARDFTFQVKDYDVNPSSGKAYINFYSLTAGSETDIPSGSSLVIKIVLKNQNEQARI